MTAVYCPKEKKQQINKLKLKFKKTSISWSNFKKKLVNLQFHFHPF